MSRRLGWRLFWALAVSLVVHVLLVAGAAFSLPDLSQFGETIEVELAPLPPPKPAPTSRPAQQPKPKLAPVAAKPKPSRPPVAPPHDAAPPAMPPVALAEPPRPPEAPPPAVEPVPSEPAVAGTAIEEEAPKPLPAPKRVEIEFAGFNGSKGSGWQLFERGEDGHYTLTGEMSMPIVLFVSGSVEQRSEGLIVPGGLQPGAFRQKITGSKPQTASFDWESHHVTLDTGKRTDVLDMPPGTQDMLSFMYQFMFVPPLEEMRMTVVTGKKLKTYVYAFEGEEALETKMGQVRTLHIGKSNRDGDEKTELWLAVDYRYLPVRIRKTEKDGSVIDLIANRLKLTD